MEEVVWPDGVDFVAGDGALAFGTGVRDMDIVGPFELVGSDCQPLPNCKIFRIKKGRLRPVEKRFFSTQYMHLLILQLSRLDSLKYSRISWTFFWALLIHESAVFEFGNS